MDKTYSIGDAIKLSRDVGEYNEPGQVIGITTFAAGAVEYVVEATRVDGAVIRHSLTVDQIEAMKETA